MLEPERIWGYRPVLAAARIGIPAGVGFGVFQTLITGSALQGLVNGVVATVVLGGIMAWWMRRSWARSSELAPEDRVAVARAVYRGEALQDERLASAVVEYAGVVRKAQEREAGWPWLPGVLGVATVIFAIGATAAGSTGAALAFWVLTALYVCGWGWIFPRRRARILANAQRAELAARSGLPRVG
jgi:hypothetical protein